MPTLECTLFKNSKEPLTPCSAVSLLDVVCVPRFIHPKSLTSGSECSTCAAPFLTARMELNRDNGEGDDFQSPTVQLSQGNWCLAKGARQVQMELLRGWRVHLCMQRRGHESRMRTRKIW